LLAVRSWNLVIFLSTIAIITFIGICMLALWLIWEIGNSKKALEEIRSNENQNEAKDEEKQKETLCACWRRYLCACWRRKVAPEPNVNFKDTINDYREKKKSKKN
jgi:hypothetical protein